MSYSVKEIYYTIQGEGAQTGRPAVFCRFSGCNLWSGAEEDRSSAVCGFCDTKFVDTNGPGGGLFDTPEALADAIIGYWPKDEGGCPFVVCTGGEPLLQLDEPLVAALHRQSCEIAVETNGTIEPPPGLDWICVSPKTGTELVIRKGDELKLAFPQRDSSPADYEELDFRYWYLQPIAGPDLKRNTQLAVGYCLMHPRWRLSMQMHKLIGLP